MVAAPADASLTNAPTPTWGTNGRVSAILPIGNTVYVGGTFTAIVDRSGTSYSASNLAAFNATTGAAVLTWAPTTDGTVWALATDGTSVYVGGSFTTVDGKSRRNLAAVTPDTGALDPWHPKTSSVVDSVAADGGAIFVSGNFSKVTGSDGTTYPQAYVAKLRSDGTVDASWAPKPDARVRALATSPDGTRIFLGGDFTSVGRSGTNKMAAVLASDGTLDPSFVSSPNNGTGYATVYALTVASTDVFEAVGGSGGACTAVDASTGAAVWSKHTNGNVHAVRVLGTSAYCGGHFSGTSSFAGLTRYKLAGVDIATGTVLGFAPRVNSALGVWSLGAGPATLYGGGDFTKISRVAEQHYAQWVDSAL